MRLLASCILLVLSGCASLLHLDRPRPEAVLDNALAALEGGDFTAAYAHLSWIHEHHWHRPVGERALLAMTAVELDPRNPGRRLEVGAELARRHDDLPRPSLWNAPVAQSLRLLASEVGEQQERIGALEREGARLAAELDRAATERERLAGELDRAERAREAARAETGRALERARQAQAEVERVRRAPTPPAPASPSAPPTNVAELQRDRDRLAREVGALRARMREQEQELERIRQALAPR